MNADWTANGQQQFTIGADFDVGIDSLAAAGGAPFNIVDTVYPSHFDDYSPNFTSIAQLPLVTPLERQMNDMDTSSNHCMPITNSRHCTSGGSQQASIAYNNSGHHHLNQHQRITMPPPLTIPYDRDYYNNRDAMGIDRHGCALTVQIPASVQCQNNIQWTTTTKHQCQSDDDDKWSMNVDVECCASAPIQNSPPVSLVGSSSNGSSDARTTISDEDDDGGSFSGGDLDDDDGDNSSRMGCADSTSCDYMHSLPPHIETKVYYPPSAVNPNAYGKGTRKNNPDLEQRRIHSCNYAG